MLVSDLSPKEVFSYFKEISDIPRGSGNTDRIAQYCVDFANSHNLLVRRDEADNVVIFKDGSKGYEDKEPLILQGHIDMVCEKSADCIRIWSMRVWTYVQMAKEFGETGQHIVEMVV